MSFDFSLNEIWHSRVNGNLFIKNLMCYEYTAAYPGSDVPILFKTYTDTGSSLEEDSTDYTITIPIQNNPYVSFPYEDSDNDGLSDRQEKNIFKTSHFDPDTDNDGLTDFDENAYGYVLGDVKSDVEINIYKESCGSYGDPLTTTTTDSNGFYNFTSLEKGNYYVEAIKGTTDFTPATVYFSIPRASHDPLNFRN